ncbi:translation elongation factor Ts [Zavarzinella formosa]|uniref:translation elongation factor Ts n=1 Tax=Zavarzinella formosa TaxID=360055 RepID=UPI000304D4C5|nr:translation elongation factor Ts [Zavarzinella formosa]
MATPITAALVQELRKRTDLPLMECKTALQNTEGDIEAAIDWLRKNGAKVSGKRAGNETGEGRVCVYVDAANQTAAIVELRCESAPVAKSDHFIALGTDIAKTIVDKNPLTVEALLVTEVAPGKTITDRFTDVISLLRENMKVHRFERLTEGQFGSYIHHDGSLGVVVQVTGSPADAALLRDVCMHVAAVSPTPISVTREEVPANVIAKEKEIATAKAMATGKPQQIAEKIAEGQLNAWLKENVLIEQPFVKDPAKTVGQLVKSAGLELKKFVRYKVGEAS